MKSSTSAAGYEDWELVVEVVDPSESSTDKAQLQWVCVPEAGEASPTSPRVWGSSTSAGNDADPSSCADVLCAVSSRMRHHKESSGGKLCCHVSSPERTSPASSAATSPSAVSDVLAKLRVTADSFLEMQLVSCSPACSSLLPPRVSMLIPSPFGYHRYDQQDVPTTQDAGVAIAQTEPTAAPNSTSRRPFFRLVPVLHWLVPSILCLVAAHHMLKGNTHRRGDALGSTLKRSESGDLLYAASLEVSGARDSPLTSSTATCRQAYGYSAVETAAAAICSP